MLYNFAGSTDEKKNHQQQSALVSSERLDGKEYSENSFFFARSFLFASYIIMTWFRHTQWRQQQQKNKLIVKQFFISGAKHDLGTKKPANEGKKSTEAIKSKTAIMLGT